MVLFLVNDLCCINSARILGIFPNPARSHFEFNRQIIYSLLKVGHHVTFVSEHREPNPPTNLTYIVPKMTKVDSSGNHFLKNDFKLLTKSQLFQLVHRKHFQFCLDLMKTPEIQVRYLHNLLQYINLGVWTQNVTNAMNII